jgi:N-acyl-L-homoserine lactone synthetase
VFSPTRTGGPRLEGDGAGNRECDARARHVVPCHRQSGEVVGIARLVLSSAESPAHSFPLQAIWQVPLESVCRSAEPPRCPASPFPKHQQGISLSSPSIMRLGLVQGLVRISQELGLTHWCAVMEPSLLRLLRRTAIHFEPLAPRRTITAFVSLVAPPSTRSLPGWPGNAQRCGPS